MTRAPLWPVAGLALCLAAPSNAQQLRLTPDDIASRADVGAGAGTSGVSGIRSTILSGDPGEPVPYTIMLTVPPNTRIAAHSHRDARSAIVFSGIWYFGYGETARDDLMRSLPPGSFYTEPQGDPHFARTGAEGATVFISGFGPTDTIYVETGAAPDRAKAPSP